MFTKRTYADVKKSTLKLQDCRKDSATRLKHLKTILDFVDVKEAKSLFEKNYSHVFFILYDTFIQVEVTLKQKDLSFQIAPKTHREELDGSLWLLRTTLCLLPELLSQRWQCHSLSRIMAKLLHLGNSSWLRKEGVRNFMLWYQVLGDNAPSNVHEMFAELIPGLIVSQNNISVADGEYDASDVLSHPNMKVEVGTSVFHDVVHHPVQTSETIALFPLSSNERSIHLNPKEGLDTFLNCLAQTTACLKWRDNNAQNDTKCFVFILSRFKNVFIPAFCPNFDSTNTIYEPKLILPTMRIINKKDEVNACCMAVLINWISRFVREKMPSIKQENINLQLADHTLFMTDNRCLANVQDKIIRGALYSTKNNINFIHEVLRQGFLLGFTNKYQIDAMRISVAVYRDWMTSKNPPPFMLEQNTSENNSTCSSSIDFLLQSQQLKSNTVGGILGREANNAINAGSQNVIQVFVTNASHVFLINTHNLNIVFHSSYREFQSTPLNEQTDVCKKVLNVYRTLVMNKRMEPKTWEQLLLVLLQVTTIVLNQNSSGSRSSLGNRLGRAIFQTLLVTWIRAHTNVPINVQLWERFISVLTALTSKNALISEWEKTMQTLTRVLGRYVYNINLQNLPLERLADNKNKRRRIVNVYPTDLKQRISSSSYAYNEKIVVQQQKDEECNALSFNKSAIYTPILGRCYSEGNLTSLKKSITRSQNKKQNIMVKPSSPSHSFIAMLDQTDVHLSFEKLTCRNNDSVTLFKGKILRRAISLNSFNYKKRNIDPNNITESRSPSTSTSSGIEGGYIKESPMQIDVSIIEAPNVDDQYSSMTPSERRSIILGGSVGGWLPGTAAIMWKRMLCSLGDINLIQKPELHAQVFQYMVEMTTNLIKIMQNQGVTEDNLTTPTPPSLIPPIGISSPWCYGAQLLGAEYKKGKLFAIKILCTLAISGSIYGKKHLSLFYDLLHKELTGEDRDRIFYLLQCLEGTRFLSLLLPGHTLLLLDIVHASAVLLTSHDVIRSSPRIEVVALLGSLLAYPLSAIPKRILKPMQQKELQECPDLHNHILSILLRCARREPSSKGRCIAFAHLGQWIFLELNRSIISENKLTQEFIRTNERENKIALNVQIRAAIQVLLQALQFNHRTITVIAAGSLKICTSQSHKLSYIENLPELMIHALCKALEVHHIFCHQESNEISLSALLMCLAELCMSLPVNIILNSISQEGEKLIVAIVRVLYNILSGKRASIVKFFLSDTDFDEKIIIDDIFVGKQKNELEHHESEIIRKNNSSIQLYAKSVIMHFLAYLGLFPSPSGASRLSSLVKEQDDFDTPDYNENMPDSSNDHQCQSILVFLLNAEIIASFIEVPDTKIFAGCNSVGGVEKKIRILLRDLNGKSCWEASLFYSKRRKLKEYLKNSQNLQSDTNKKIFTPACQELFYELNQLNADVTALSRHSIRHRQSNKLPVALEQASDLDQLGDLLQYLGHLSPECLTHSSQLNVFGVSPLGYQLEAQTISILLNQRSIEQEQEKSLNQSINEAASDFTPSLYQAPDQTYHSHNIANIDDSKMSMQLRRLLFSHLGLISWERRNQTYLLERSEKLKRELRNVDIQKCRDTHKVAVVYVANGQEDKNSILQNTHGSNAYESFVSALGWEIDLETHNGFLGGLPRHGCGATAPYYATSFVEVIYHAATRMPSNTPEALLTKTRHLGNDEVHIVWSEHHREYRRDILPTDFCDILIVIYPLKNSLFRVTVNWKPDVPWFGPLANESIVNGSCLATLVRETAINASRSKRSSLSLYEQYYEERNRSLGNISMLYKENSTFEDFVNRIYTTNHQILVESAVSNAYEHLVETTS